MSDLEHEVHASVICDLVCEECGVMYADADVEVVHDGDGGWLIEDDVRCFVCEGTLEVEGDILDVVPW